MPKKLNVGDTYTETECINGFKEIVTYKVVQVTPVFRAEEISREKTSDPCDDKDK
jgi:hypothetical protein